jgi:hypothetical protein
MMNRLSIVSALLLVGLALPLQALAQEGGVPAAQSVESQIAATIARFATFAGRVDHAAAGCGLRNFDSCTIRLRGIPANSTIIRALLYWAQICSGTSCPATVDIEFQGRTITSRLIGTNPQPCWAGSLIGGYQVDVTGLMAGRGGANSIGNGDYQVNAIPSHPGDRHGGDPWSPSTSNLPKAEGATLVAVYTNPALSATGQVHIHHGVNTILGGTFDATLPLAPAAPSPIASAKFTRFGADGQVGSGVTPSGTTPDDITRFGGPSGSCPSAVLTQIAGPGATHALSTEDSDWNGDDGGPLNQLWDTHTSTVTGLLGGGAANYCVRYTAPGDCLTFIGYGLTVR